MRTFVAVFPPPGVRRAVLEAARREISGERVRWTRPHNFHLTLKFLGEVPEERLEEIAAALRQTCARHGPFDASLSGFGAFPSARRARILWVGVGAGSDEVRVLAADVDAALEPLGFGGKERPYAPHATLGRIRGRPASLLELPPIAPEERGFRVGRADLVKSTLTAEGSVYETLESFALVGESYGKEPGVTPGRGS